MTLASKAQIVNIPDANLKAKLLAANASNTIASTASPTFVEPFTYIYWQFSTYNSIDSNNDGEIQVSEAQAIKVLQLQNSNISDLTGLEAFANLEFLNVYYNPITNINTSQNSALRGLYCGHGQLSSIDVSQNPNLVMLDCYDGQITSLNLEQNSNLKVLRFYGNQLGSIDVSHNINLKELSVTGSLINSLDVSANTALIVLRCGFNQLNNLDVTQNTALTELYCMGNQLTTIDISHNTALTSLYIYNNQLTNIDLTQNSNLNSLIIYHNSLTSLDVSSNPALHNLICSNNQLTTLNLTANQNLSYVDCSYNQLETFLFNNCARLNSVVCSHNLLTSLAATNLPNITEIDCQYNNLTSLDLTGSGNSLGTLFILDCGYNNLTTINTNVMALAEGARISCWNNPNLTTILAKNGAQFQDGSPHEPPYPNLFIGGTPNLQYICVDSFNINFVQNLLSIYGYTGCTVDSACELGTNQFENSKLVFSPNPAKDFLQLENTNQLIVKSINFYDVLGQIVIAIPNAENVSTIDVSDLKTGTYFIKVNTDKGTTNAKFLKK